MTCKFPGCTVTLLASSQSLQPAGDQVDPVLEARHNAILDCEAGGCAIDRVAVARSENTAILAFIETALL